MFIVKSFQKKNLKTSSWEKPLFVEMIKLSLARPAEPCNISRDIYILAKVSANKVSVMWQTEYITLLCIQIYILAKNLQMTSITVAPLRPKEAFLMNTILHFSNFTKAGLFIWPKSCSAWTTTECTAFYGCSKVQTSPQCPYPSPWAEI